MTLIKIGYPSKNKAKLFVFFIDFYRDIAYHIRWLNSGLLSPGKRSNQGGN